jgi:hypothetical protein
LLFAKQSGSPMHRVLSISESFYRPIKKGVRRLRVNTRYKAQYTMFPHVPSYGLCRLRPNMANGKQIYMRN